MNYVTTSRFKGLALCGKILNIPYGQKMDERGGILYWNDQAVCAVESDNGFRHFSYDGDGRGKERGAITYAIACGDHGKPVALSDAENQLLRDKWNQYLRSLSDANIMNADFFKAPVEILMQIAEDLHFKTRKGKYYYAGTGPEPFREGETDVRDNLTGGSGPLHGQPGIYNAEIPERMPTANNAG